LLHRFDLVAVVSYYMPIRWLVTNGSSQGVNPVVQTSGSSQGVNPVVLTSGSSQGMNPIVLTRLALVKEGIQLCYMQGH